MYITGDPSLGARSKSYLKAGYCTSFILPQGTISQAGIKTAEPFPTLWLHRGAEDSKSFSELA